MPPDTERLPKAVPVEKILMRPPLPAPPEPTLAAETDTVKNTDRGRRTERRRPDKKAQMVCQAIKASQEHSSVDNRLQHQKKRKIET